MSERARELVGIGDTAVVDGGAEFTQRFADVAAAALSSLPAAAVLPSLLFIGFPVWAMPKTKTAYACKARGERGERRPTTTPTMFIEERERGSASFLRSSELRSLLPLHLSVALRRFLPVRRPFYCLRRGRRMEEKRSGESLDLHLSKRPDPSAHSPAYLKIAWRRSLCRKL